MPLQVKKAKTLRRFLALCKEAAPVGKGLAGGPRCPAPRDQRGARWAGSLRAGMRMCVRPRRGSLSEREELCAEALGAEA